MPDATSIMDFLGKLLGAAPPQPQAQPTPGFGGIAGPPSPGVTAPQTAPGHMGLMDVLGSPGAQGALQAYFSLLSQPRVQGWGRGLGAAGLQGLQGFEQAREAQAKLPLQQAQLQEAQARVPALQAETKKSLAEAGAYEGLSPEERKAAIFPGLATSEQAKAANQAIHDALYAESSAPGQDLEVAKRLRAQGDFALKAATPQDINKLREDAYTPPGLKAQKEQAGLKEVQKRTEQIGKPTPRTEDYYVPNAAGGYDLISTATPPPNAITKGAYEKLIGDKDRAALVRVRQAAYNEAVKVYQASHPSHLGGLIGGPNESDMRAAGQAAADEAEAKFLAGSGAPRTPGSPPPTAAKGATTIEADVLDTSPPAGSEPTRRTAEGGKLREYRHPDGSLHFHPAGPM